MDPQLESWLKGFPRETVESKIRSLEAELAQWRNALTIHDSLVGTNGAAPKAAAEIPTKPVAIFTILSEANTPLKSGAILKSMVQHGWLPDDGKAKRRFYATMSRLKGEARIRQLPDGRYQLPQEVRLQLQ